MILLRYLVLFGSLLSLTLSHAQSNPILFVTQIPVHADFATIGSVFANHGTRMRQATRGGDLYIRYPNGVLRNLTAEAGFGDSGFQGADAIAVRDPAVHWSGNKAVFSMLIGAPTERFQQNDYFWQLYEVTGLAANETVVITKIPNQPADYNNVSPVYASDDRILFISDRPRNGERHLYPQLDEYETTFTNTGIWSLDPTDGDLFLLDHSPSGDFDPMVDSFGRVIFTRWDHLQRDQQADADALNVNEPNGTFNYASEAANAARLNNRDEVFPEPRPVRTDLLNGTNMIGHRFNHFFPWQIRQDGTEMETLNHIGRHELHSYFNRNFNDDNNLSEFIDGASGRTNPNDILNLLQIQEDPNQPGYYIGTDAPEFDTHASGQLVALQAAPNNSPEQIVIDYITHPDTGTVTNSPSANHSGHYRDPLILADTTIIAVHTPETGGAANQYQFRLRTLSQQGNGFMAADGFLTNGINKTISYFDPDNEVQYSGPLWELNPVEVRARPAPATSTVNLAPAEQQIFTQQQVDPQVFQQYLQQHDLAVMVVRDATSRDVDDLQQPFNLRVANGGKQTIGASGKIYDVEHFQFYQGDQIRGIGGTSNPDPGRRVLAQALHEQTVLDHNPANPSGPPGTVAIAADGSVAAFVPVRRAMSWQMLDPAHNAVVRERYWLTFQPGEIRVCDGCHGVNNLNQAGNAAANQPPQALALLLQHWQDLLQNGTIFADDFD